MDRNVESLYLCGFSVFVLSNGFGLIIFVVYYCESHYEGSKN